MNNVFHWSNFPKSKKTFLHKPLAPEEFYKKIKLALQHHKAVVLDLKGLNNDPSHSVAITDVEVRRGKVVAVEIKNSDPFWRGDGYVWFSTEEVSKYLHRAWIYDLH